MVTTEMSLLSYGMPVEKNRTVDFVFENCDAAVLGTVHDKRVGGMKLDRLAVSG